jgi:hypothetical protein
MGGLLTKKVISTPLDGAEGALGPKKLAILVVVLLVVGALVIFLVQNILASNNTWEATVTGVGAQGTFINFTFDEESNDVDVASYPAGMEIAEGDRVLIRTDEDEGNVVVKVLGK